MKTVKLQEWHEQMRAQGVPIPLHIAFVCVRCKTPQTMQNFIDAGVDKERAEKLIGFSCIGRFANDVGCDWTLGGLFGINEVEVVTDDGRAHPSFDLATPEQAQALLAARGGA